MTATVSALDIHRATGLTYRQIDHWTGKGWLQTAGDINPGSGRAREYPEDQLGKASLMQRLIGAGIRPSVAHYAAMSLREHREVQIGTVLISLASADEVSA